MSVYSARFLSFMPFIFEWEGGYDNDPDDPGGETKYGIDKRTHPKEDIKNLTKERATQIYWRDYWANLDGVDYPLGEVIFNCNINCGAGRTSKIMAAIAPQTAQNFVNEQEAFYRRLVASRPQSRKYLKGWLNRLNALRGMLGIKT